MPNNGQTEQQKTQEWADKGRAPMGATLTDDMIKPLEKKLEELEHLLFVKNMIAARGEDPLAVKRDIPTYDPEDKSRRKPQSQEDNLRSARDTIKRLLDEYYFAKMIQMHAGPRSRRARAGD